MHTAIHSKTASTSRRVNELILSGSNWEPSVFLSPLLNQLASEDKQRWLTLVLSEQNTCEILNWIKSAGINSSTVRVLNRKSSMKSLELTYRALESGTSHTVIGWISQMDQEDLSRLESAARSGQCHCLTIRNREAA